jgi:uncharacterized protein (UPF0276 family)
MPSEDPREFGIGVVYSPRIARILDFDLVDVLEIEPQIFWHPTGVPDDPVRVDLELFSQLRALPQHKLVHSVTLPVGNSRPHDPGELQLLAQSVAALGAPYASEHLSFNRSDAGRLWTGFLLPPRQDENGVEVAAARLDEMRRAVGVPVAFETNVNYLRPQQDEMSDGCFIRSVAEAADCGILLDLHNLLTNERNGRDTLGAVFDEIPHERIWEIHLAGGMPYRGYWLDSHSGRIEDELFAATREIVDACPNLRAVVFEMMEQYIDESVRDALRDDLLRLRALWAERRRARGVAVRSSAHGNLRREADLSRVRRREETLGALAIGQQPRDPDPAIVSDPATALYADLVASMREGALYEGTPFLLRLLLASLGHAATMNLLSEYCASTVPAPFGGDETRNFLVYVRDRALDIPHIAEILDLEEALNAVQRTGEEQIVAFDCDPVALLAALAERKIPPLAAPERFHVIVSTNGLDIRPRENLANAIDADLRAL